MQPQNTYFQLKNPERLGAIFGIIFIIWAILVKTNSFIIQNFDGFFIKLITNDNQNLLAIVKQITRVGNTKTITWLTIIVTLVLILLKRPYFGAWFAGTMILSNLTNYTVKNIVQRPRPNVKHLIYAGGYSFPSGHSIGSMTFFILLAIVFLILVKNKTAKFSLAVLSGIMPLLIGYTRIYVHVHYPSDVLGGFILAWTFIFLSIYVLQKWRQIIVQPLHS